MSNLATGRTVFVLGKELHGNRETQIFETGEAYDLDPAAIVNYSVVTTRFPYEL